MTRAKSAKVLGYNFCALKIFIFLIRIHCLEELKFSSISPLSKDTIRNISPDRLLRLAQHIQSGINLSKIKDLP